MLKTYKELVVWQKSMRLCKRLYEMTHSFPADERFGLTAQIRRAAVSFPSNIAEGYGRGTTRDYVRFLWMASGSTAEIETQLLLSRELGFLPAEHASEALESLAEVERMLSALIRSLEEKQ